MSPPHLVLASASPRRRELLTSLGLRFTVRPVGVPEVPAPGETAHRYVLRLAREKAAAVAHRGELVIAADTVVVLPDDRGDDRGGPEGGEILEKPVDRDHARRMLGRIAGRTHTVYTGVALTLPRDGDAAPRTASAVDVTRVEIASLSESEIDWYVGTGEPLDKAGSYAIQELGALFVERVEGNYSNVVGLPLPTVYRLMAEVGYDLRDFTAGEAGDGPGPGDSGAA